MFFRSRNVHFHAWMVELSSVVTGGEGAKPAPEFVADPTKDGKTFFRSADSGSWRVFESVVELLGITEKDGAGFFGVIADGDDVVKRLAFEFGHVFGAVAGKVDAEFSHGGDGFGADQTGFYAGAFHFEFVPGVVAEEAFGHLASGGVSGAENEDSFFGGHELALGSVGGTSQRKRSVAAAAPASWAAMKPGASCGRIPAKVLVAARARVTAGFAKDVEAVNQ